MKPLKIKFINDIKIWKVTNGPGKIPEAHFGLGLKALSEMIASKENGTKSILDLPPIHEEDACQELDVCTKPTTLIQNGEHVPGFQTPSRRRGMLDKAESAVNSPRTPKSCRTPSTPKLSLNRTPKTPVSLTRRSLRATPPRTPSTPTTRTPRTSKRLYTTPSSTESKASSTRKGADTPYSLRTKIKKRIVDIVSTDESEDDLDDSDMDEHYRPSDEDTDEDYSLSEGDKTPITKNATPSRRRNLFQSFPKTPLRTPRRGREPKVDVDMAASSEDYFMHNFEGGKSLTSDHTLNKLETPRLGPEALKVLLGGAFKSHEQERNELIEDHSTLFPHWMTLLCEGFSIFLCGVGSKKGLLSRFQKDILAECDHMVVNGFFPSLTIRTILSSIIEDIIGLDVHPQGVTDQLRLITSHYSQPKCDPLFLIVHDLDGPMLRNDKAQTALSKLSSLQNIHLIASLDHINAPLIFDSTMRSAYNPLWWDATTLAPYTEETSYENSLLVQQTGALALSSLLHVFKSLTPNAKGIFLVLAKHQLSKQDNSNYAGLAFDELYQRCRENFLVNSDLTLRAQLTEFKDHKLIKTKKSYDGGEHLIIPLEASTLQEFLDQQEE